MGLIDNIVASKTHRDAWKKSRKPDVDTDGGGGGGSGRPGSAAGDQAKRIAAAKEAARVAHIRALRIQRARQAHEKALAAKIARITHQNKLREIAAANKAKRKEAAEQRAENRRLLKQKLARERKADITGLKAERETAYAGMGEDEVRQTMFGLGLGDEADPFSTRAKGLKTKLDPIKGVKKTRDRQEQALGRLLGSDVNIGKKGVTGLGSVLQAASAWQKSDAAKRLLSSAFGVGSLREGEAPGLSLAEQQRQIASVTPTGAFAL